MDQTIQGGDAVPDSEFEEFFEEERGKAEAQQEGLPDDLAETPASEGETEQDTIAGAPDGVESLPPLISPEPHFPDDDAGLPPRGQYGESGDPFTNQAGLNKGWILGAMGVVLVAGAIVFLVIYAVNSLFSDGSSDDFSSETPVIAASDEPVRVRPEEGQGQIKVPNSDISVLDSAAGDRREGALPDELPATPERALDPFAPSSTSSGNEERLAATGSEQIPLDSSATGSKQIPLDSSTEPVLGRTNQPIAGPEQGVSPQPQGGFGTERTTIPFDSSLPSSSDFGKNVTTQPGGAVPFGGSPPSSSDFGETVTAQPGQEVRMERLPSENVGGFSQSIGGGASGEIPPAQDGQIQSPGQKQGDSWQIPITDDSTGTTATATATVPEMEKLEPDGQAEETVEKADDPVQVASVRESATRDAANIRPQGGAWKVQLSALRSDYAAERHWELLSRAHSDLFSGLRPDTKHATSRTHGQIVRLRVAGFASKENAGTFCRKLRERSVSCIVTR